MLARNLSAAPASLLWSKSDQLKIYIRFYHTGLSREKINEGYLLCSCNLWKYWFSFYSEFGASVCNHSLADYTVLVTVSLTHGERERLQTSRVRLEICYLHTAPPVKVLNQASPQHLSANKRHFRFTCTSTWDSKTLSTVLLQYLCVHLQPVLCLT